MRNHGRAALDRRGQATTEWAVLLAVIVIAIVAAGAVLVQTFPGAMEGAGAGASRAYASGELAR